ncbi:hypothetical protein [Agrobacterium cavarae]|uniref:hypothetical protein n=1 Tax=Agrobacterium cavarae TaxID=2528239 RepID=UPI003CFEE6C5
MSNYTMHTTEMIELHRGIAWWADLLKDGIKIGSVENRGDGGADHVYIADKSDRAEWYQFVADKFEDDEEQATFDLQYQEEAMSVFGEDDLKGYAQ